MVYSRELSWRCHVWVISLESKFDESVRKCMHRIFPSMDGAFNTSSENIPEQTLPLTDVMVDEAWFADASTILGNLRGVQRFCSCYSPSVSPNSLLLPQKTSWVVTSTTRRCATQTSSLESKPHSGTNLRPTVHQS